MLMMSGFMSKYKGIRTATECEESTRELIKEFYCAMEGLLMQDVEDLYKTIKDVTDEC